MKASASPARAAHFGRRRLEQRRLRRDRPDGDVLDRGRRRQDGRGDRRVRGDSTDAALAAAVGGSGAALRRSAFDALGDAAAVVAQLAGELRERVFRLRRLRSPMAAWSMPVATTETRMMPSRLSSKVAPTMMLAS